MAVSLKKSAVGVIPVGHRVYVYNFETDATDTVVAATDPVIKKTGIYLSGLEIIHSFAYTSTAGGTGAKVQFVLVDSWPNATLSIDLGSQIDISAAVSTKTEVAGIDMSKQISDLDTHHVNPPSYELALKFTGATLPAGVKLTFVLFTIGCE